MRLYNRGESHTSLPISNGSLDGRGVQKLSEGGMSEPSWLGQPRCTKDRKRNTKSLQTEAVLTRARARSVCARVRETHVKRGGMAYAMQEIKSFRAGLGWMPARREERERTLQTGC